MKKLNIIAVLGLISLAAACGKAKNVEEAASGGAPAVSLNGSWQLVDRYCGSVNDKPAPTSTISISINDSSQTMIFTTPKISCVRTFSKNISNNTINFSSFGTSICTNSSGTVATPAGKRLNDAFELSYSFVLSDDQETLTLNSVGASDDLFCIPGTAISSILTFNKI